MKNGDFELNGYMTGPGCPVFVTDFQPGSTGERNQDVDDVFDDLRVFGRDQLTPPVWSFKFSVAQPSGAAPSAVLDSLEALAKAWRGAGDRRKPGTVVPLRYMIKDRVRVVYGRPRNFAYDPSRNIEDGDIEASAQFALRDTVHYSDELVSSELMLRQPPTGYVTLPAVWPLLSVVQSDRQGSFVLPGSVPVQPEEIVFYGPVTNPAVATAEWSVALNGTIPYDGWVSVDPKNRTVLNQGGGSVAGWLSRKTYLPDVQLNPGPVGLTFTGTDPTATARVVVRARAGYYTL